MAYKAPGKSYRKGITLLELAAMFPDEEAARQWFEQMVWPNGERWCPGVYLSYPLQSNRASHADIDHFEAPKKRPSQQR